jgi:hypothetical protein
LYAKPSRAPTLICSPCCAIFAWNEVGIWDSNFVFQMDPRITNFLLLVISSQKSRFGAHEARQWPCPRFVRVVCVSSKVEEGKKIKCSPSTQRSPGWRLDGTVGKNQKVGSGPNSKHTSGRTWAAFWRWKLGKAVMWRRTEEETWGVPPDHLLLTVLLILDHSYLVGKLTSSKIADTKV